MRIRSCIFLYTPIMRLVPWLLCLALPLAAATIDDVKREAALVRELAIRT